MRRLAPSATVLLALPLAWACTPEREPQLPEREPSLADTAGMMAPAHRFAPGPAHRFAPAPSQRGATPTATLLDDTRPVLRAPGRVDLRAQRAPVGANGKLHIEAPLPPSYDDVGQALGRVVLFGGGVRHELPLTAHPLERSGENRVFTLRVPLPAELRESQRIGFRLLGLGVPAPAEQSVETAPLAIPPASRLEFAIGVLEPELADGPVAFELSICRQTHCETLLEESLDPRQPEQRGWQDRRVPLAPHAGEQRHLRFSTRRLDAGETALPVWANPTLYVASPRPPGAHNVILVSIDTLRADHLPSYGYGRNTAPYVEEHFARGGVLFERFIAASTVTAPSHMTMFTGLQPSAHGVTDGLRALPRSIPTLPEILRASGISTAAFTENGWVGVHQGFARGFDQFVENKSAEIMVPEGQVDVTFGQARDWLVANADKRFFLFVHTYQVHAPYAPPATYAPLFGESGAEGAAHLRDMADYDREIRYVDDELRELIATLEATGNAEDTIVVLTSDHGEEFLEHGLLSHGGHLYEETLRVPLLIHGPGIPAGQRVATPVAMADLMPTLLELFDLPAPADREARSLLPLVRGADPAAFAGRPLYSEGLVKYQAGSEGVRSFDPPIHAVSVGPRKLVRDRERGEVRYELYDLAADPLERRNLLSEERVDASDPRTDAGHRSTDASHRSTDASDLRALLERYPAEQQARQRRLADGAPDEEAPPIDPERERKLRALGYLE